MSPYKGISGFVTNTNDAAPNQRRNRLLLIGIDEYEHWGKLQYPVGDCNQFFELLREHYGFGEQDLIQSLYNEQATADIIFDELYRLQESDENGNPHLSTNDNLILYFSGHGHLDKSLDEGYWVPIEAPVPKRPADLRNLVSVSEVVKILSQVKAHHILLIVDACFSGAFARMAVEVMPGGDPNNPEEKPSRWVLTAGRLQPVPDKSEFAEALRQVLEANESPKISIDWVGAEVAKKVRENTRYNPWCGTLVKQKYEGGEFFFRRLTTAQRTDHAQRPDIAIAKLPERLRQGSATHLERLKKGRFKHLNIIQLLLTGNNLPDLIDTQVKSGEEETPLQQAVQSLWGREKPHAVVLGDGGMGKTVSLVRLWEDMLKQSSVDSRQLAVPVFVALNEYNAIPESEKHDFVLRSIARNCGLAEALTDDWKNTLWELLKTPFPNAAASSLTPNPSSLPSVLLMLDGFNEVTVKKDQLLIDLNRLSEQAKGMQMVITSRYVEIQNFTWAQHSEVVELLPLPSDKIGEYLQQVNLPLPEDEALQKLFGNPMMLTLYAGASSIAKKYEHDQRFRFLPTGSYGELLWNFNEAQLARHLEDLEHAPDEQAWHCFLLRCLVPRLAYKMELEGQFFVPTRKALNPAFNFKTLLDEAFADLNREELTEVFPELDGKRSLLGLGELSDLDAREQRSQKVLKYLVEKLHLLVAEDEALRFVHQNFRDFFAACHLRNVAEMALVRGVLPEEWKVRTFPVYLRRMIGEMEGEQHIDAQKILSRKSSMIELEQNCLARLLRNCRGNFEENENSVGFVVWNILNILNKIRGTLAGLDLSLINLEKIILNNSLFVSHYNKNYLYTSLKGSLFQIRQFLPHGHSRSVVSICYSPEGKRILTGSEDGTAREWLVATGKCLQTFEGHKYYLTGACYSPDGRMILTASGDKTAKVWSISTGKCLHTFEGHDAGLISCYCPDGEKVLTVGGKILKEWSVQTGMCLRTFERDLFTGIESVCYSSDGKKILTASVDKTIKEWSIETLECLQAFEGHTDVVKKAYYSPDEEKILSISWDKTIKEWSVKSGNCTQTFKINTEVITSACYSPDGKRIIAGTTDMEVGLAMFANLSFDWEKKKMGAKKGTIVEWLVETGERFRTIQGKEGGHTCICYNKYGTRLFFGSRNGSITEWLLEEGICSQTMEGFSNDITSARFNPRRDKVLISSKDATAKEWSVKTGVCLQILIGHSGAICSACYSSNGKKILTASEDRKIIEWSVKTGEILQILEGHSNVVKGACYSRNCHKVLSYSNDGTVKEWQVATGQCLNTIVAHNNYINSACYSSDEKRILTTSDDETIKEWSVETGKCLQTFHVKDKVNNACYSPDGKKVLSVWNNILKEWSVETGNCIGTIKCETYNLIAGYTSCGKSVMSLSLSNREVQEWSMEAGNCIREWKGGAAEFVFHSIIGNEQVCKEKGTYLRVEPFKVEEKTASGKINNYFPNEIGLHIQSVDFRHLHPDSHFTEEEKEHLRRYGAIFSEEDERRWKEAVADAYGDLEDDDEPENPPQP